MTATVVLLPDLADVTVLDREEFVAFAWTNGLLDERFEDEDPATDEEALELLSNAVMLGLLAPDDEVPGIAYEECPICGLPELATHEACEEADA